MNKALPCKKHSRPRRDQERGAKKTSPSADYLPKSNVPMDMCGLNGCCGDSASTVSSSEQSCCSYSCCRSASPAEGSYACQDSQSRNSRNSTPGEDDYSSVSKNSQSKYPPPSGDPTKDSFMSTHMLYATVLMFAMGMLLLMLKMKFIDNTDSCHICDERSLPDPFRVDKLDKSSKKYVVDYASEENGACVETHDTYHYIQRGSFAAADLLRLPSVDSVSPDTILKDNEECFAMQGHAGTFLIRLARPIIVDAVTLVHNKAECDAAPRDFKIFGVHDQKDEAQVNLGGFRYENRGRPAQKFVVPKFHEFAYVGLNIMSNWGNRDYTCIYKIKVHGEPED